MLKKILYFTGVKIQIPEDVDFLLQGHLKVVIGDLQGLPEVFFTRAPTADVVGTS